jgi:hypothetical protein
MTRAVVVTVAALTLSSSPVFGFTPSLPTRTHSTTSLNLLNDIQETIRREVGANAWNEHDTDLMSLPTFPLVATGELQTGRGHDGICQKVQKSSGQTY